MIAHLLIVAMASAFVTSFVDRWLPVGIYRGVVALATSGLGMLSLGYFGVGQGTLMSFAAAFGSLMLILAGERLATPPPIAIDNRRR